MTTPSEKELLDATQRLRQQSEHELDEFTVARLRAARLRALSASPQARFTWRLAGGFVAAGLALAVAGVMWFQTPGDFVAPPLEPAMADLDLLTSENPDFYAELEFYSWLARAPDAS